MLFDAIMYVVSGKFTWVPLYLFFIVTFIKLTKKWVLTLLIAVVLVILADIGASQLAKPNFQRLRPCHDTSIENVHTVDGHCGKAYGFFSSHAAISSALAMFMWLIFYQFGYRKAYLLLPAWALLTSYSRVYLGVHFPLDVITGIIYGSGLAYGAYRLANYFRAI